MNAPAFPLRAQSYEELRDQRIEESRADASLARAIARYEQMTGKPFRDPEPEQTAEARKRADAAVRALVEGLVADADREVG